MIFNINNCCWEIKEVSQEEIKKEMQQRYENGIEGKPVDDGRYFGITYHDSQIIFLDKGLPKDRKKKTLIHELTHCYIGSYITHMDKTYCEEDICDIVSNSYDFVSDIIEKYFKKNLDK